MKIFQEILAQMTEKEDLIFHGVKYVILDGVSGYFENIKSILSFSSTEIQLSAKKGVIVVQGEKLYIKKYCAEDLVICGNIISVGKKL